MGKEAIISIIVVIGMIFVYLVFFAEFNSKSDIIDAKTAECIGEKSTLYVKQGCPACNTQKEVFGENLEYLDVIDCSEEPAKCLDGGVLEVPTWHFDDKKVASILSAEQLKEITGC